MTLYRWANRPSSTTGSDYLIQNLDDFRFLDAAGNPIPMTAPYRKYRGAMFVLTKAMSHNWQGQISYVWSKTKGNINNTGRSGFGGSGFENPNNSIVNTEGYLSNDRTHELKVMLGYTIPIVDVQVSGFVRAISGGNYTSVPSTTVSSRTLNWFSSLRPNLEPLGSHRYPMRKTVDFRLEKLLRFGPNRISVFMDAGNLFNASVVTGRQTRYPNRTISLAGGGSAVVLYDSPTAVLAPRQIMFGGRWTF
jgi:hypothetical protein